MILITGGNGQLGYDFQRLFKSLNLDFLAPDLADLDITDSPWVKKYITENILNKGKKLDLIINCAAYNNVDKAEVETELCYKINSYAPRDLALIAKEYNCDFITYSTDFVFGGDKTTPYIEEDEVNPLSVYSKSKALGEKLVLEAYERSFVVRTSWVFGVANNNFNKQVLSWASSKEVLSIADDLVSAPTYSKDLGEFSWKLIQTKKYGLYHIANNEIASKYDQAKYLLEKTGWKGELKRGKNSDFNLPAARPAYSKLDCSKIEKLLGETIPTWKDAIDRYLKDSQ